MSEDITEVIIQIDKVLNEEEAQKLIDVLSHILDNEKNLLVINICGSESRLLTFLSLLFFLRNS